MININEYLIEKLVPTYTTYFYSKPVDSDERFWHISGYICCYLLNVLYRKFIGHKDAQPIEMLPIEKKEKYWRLACIYHNEEPERIKASKAAYVLELITSTF